MKKGRKFEWSGEHTKSVRRLKEALVAALALRKAVYGKEVPIYVNVDTSPNQIGWMINQEDENVVALLRVCVEKGGTTGVLD